jgi:beta-D-xylosidase 4
VGEYAEYFVKGFERAPEDPEHIQASACCKHYAANSMEHTTEGGQTHTRHDFSATITQQDLVDSYLFPFQSCVEKGKVTGKNLSTSVCLRAPACCLVMWHIADINYCAGLMCSYNSINGVPSCGNNWLLDEVARGDWGFDG